MWDVFISHASEDKESFVRPLAKRLKEVYKVDVWYDEFSLEAGDSLIDSIEYGLENSKFGVVVFSESFFGKMWTERETKILKLKEMALNKKVIIPIWYNLSKEQMEKYSLILADKLAILANGEINVDNIAIDIIKVVRKDIYNNLGRMQAFEEVLQNATVALCPGDTAIKPPPIRHESLSPIMKARLKLVHNAIQEISPDSYEEYETDFRRSINIDREIVITELLTAAYLDCISLKEMSLEKKKILYAYIITNSFSSVNLEEQIKKVISREELLVFKKIIDSYINDIDAHVVMEYKFWDKEKE